MGITPVSDLRIIQGTDGLVEPALREQGHRPLVEGAHSVTAFNPPVWEQPARVCRHGRHRGIHIPIAFGETVAQKHLTGNA